MRGLVEDIAKVTRLTRSGHANAILDFRYTQSMEPLEDGRIEHVGVFDCCPPKPKDAMQ
jgi:hypothetical protein